MSIHRIQVFGHLLVHRCPPWFAYLLDNPIRRRIHSTDRLFGPYVKPGMRVLDVGVGFGFTTIGLAKLVGPDGKVIAVDAQEGMIAKVRSRLSDAGFSDRVETVCKPVEELVIQDTIDFVNVFYMLHEVDDPERLFSNVLACLKSSGVLFLAEPMGHVSRNSFEKELALGIAQGFEVIDRPRVVFSHAAVLSPT